MHACTCTWVNVPFSGIFMRNRHDAVESRQIRHQKSNLRAISALGFTWWHFFFFQTRLSTRAGAEQRAWNLWLGVKPFSHSGLPGKWCNSANFWSQASRKILGQLFFHNLSFHVFALSSNGRDFFFNFSLEAKKNSFWRENRRTIWQTEHQCCQRFILANVTAANHFARHGGPFPWRPHFLPS